jgi:hypothetical protein
MNIISINGWYMWYLEFRFSSTAAGKGERKCYYNYGEGKISHHNNSSFEINGFRSAPSFIV